MRIKRVLVRTMTKRYAKAFSNPHFPWTEKNAVLAFVETESGVLGVGEAWCDSGVTRSVATLIECDLAPRILGEPVSAPERLWARMFSGEVMSLKGGALYAAISAVDTAVWDAYAKSLGQPLYKLLGGCADAVPVYGSSGLYATDYGPDDLARDMAGAMEQGCCGVKIKVAGASVPEDIERVRAVREAIGPDARLMVDALFKPNVPESIRLARALQPFDLYFYEAPTNRRDLRGWVDVRNATGLAISGPEVESGLDTFRRFLDSGAVDYLQADVSICGGVTEMRRIAGLGQAYLRPFTVHVSGSAVAFAANAQVAAAFSGSDSVELHLLHQTLYERLWDAGWRIANGRVHLPDLPGIGLDLSPDDACFNELGKL